MNLLRPGPDFQSRFRAAFRIPLAFALGLSAYGLVVSRASDGAQLARLGLTPLGLIAFYFGLATFAALIVALFGSWATTRVRGALLGFVSGGLLAFLLNLILALRPGDEPMWGLGLALYMVTLGLVPGAVAGAVFWRAPEPTDPAD